MTMTPLEQYQADLQREDFFQDAAQLRAVEALDDLYHRLLQEPGKGLLGRFRKPQPQMGLYMWGGVGRGKT
ncbi:MAG: AFG1/ZapE family ATPase, partial [Alcanivorax nanhaiticus]